MLTVGGLKNNRTVDSAWAAPGPGHWALETSHWGGSITPLYAGIYCDAIRAGSASSFSRYGVGAHHLELAVVRSRPYMRVIPVREPPRVLGDRVPPYPLAWALSRALPELRRRNASARAAFDRRLWRDECREWDEERASATAANLVMQREDVTNLSDRDLADHLTQAAAAASEGVRRHFDLLCATSLPIGDLVVEAQRAGLTTEHVFRWLSGSSPASAAPVAHLHAIRTAVGHHVRILDEVTSANATARQLLESYLEAFGHRIVTRYDIDGLTLLELPDLIVRTINVASETCGSVPSEAPPSAGAVEEDSDDLRQVLREAQAVYGTRDDNAGVLLQWRTGLLRRAVVEAAERLVRAGRLRRQGDVFVLSLEELRSALDTALALPTAATRADARADALRDPPPVELGSPEPRPPLNALPQFLRRASAAMLAFSDTVYTRVGSSPLQGTAIGSGIHRGRACVAGTVDEAVERVQPGDILVTPLTTPAFNTLLPLLSGLVVEQGGAMSHAAIVAREFGIPAVIGAIGATASIPDGAAIELDLGSGVITLGGTAASGSCAR